MPMDDAVEASIARVLAAEAEALATVARARDDAATIAEQAREAARRIELRTDRRLRAVRAAFAANVAAQVSSREAQTAAMDAAHILSAEEVASVERAARATASMLTGGRP